MISDRFILFVIEERNKARKAGDYSRADTIREVLLKYGIVLEDTRDGTVYRRIFMV
jgi:cysteinyl-tRNA synthetase